ncbi:hypothetical protein HQ865_23040 [Mucilaginibacter mali]|uniref:Tail specific protease domain-containing protein n=1 Tax=Mucilaginibacter mali TaxID=2740462 RepID=A0A7D4TQ99_9SPHI|nr:S41 family peptidase [Mucilaginibacter mali]QKJ32513.1 hypothetical protein HQ865_23040 [Mucilaginibacter mali]
MKTPLRIALFVLASAFSLPLFAQQGTPGNLAADFVQRQRDTARHLYNKDHATKQDIEQGIGVLKRSIRFLDSPAIKKMAETNMYLKFRRSDVLREMVYAYAKNGQNDLATATLTEHYKEGTSFYIIEMLADSAFIQLKTDPKFMAVIDHYKARSGLWAGDAFKTPYKADLSATEKLAGLSLLWAQAKLGFAYFDRLTVDWNQTYLDYIPQVQATKSTLEYYKVLQKFYAQLHDGHTNVYFPKELTNEIYSRPPVRTELIGGHVYITKVVNDSLQKTGIVPGLEVISIDHQPVKAYADANVRPFQSSSTPQDLDQRTYTYMLLAGAASKPINLELKDRKGKIFTATIPRSGYPKVAPLPAMEYKELNGIGYLAIHNFEDDKIVKQFDSLFTQVQKTKGLVIDIRDNGGGDSGIGNQILAYLTDKQFDLFSHSQVTFNALNKAPGQPEPNMLGNGVAIEYPNKKHYYNKPVTLLINAATFSAAEDFAVAFDAMKRGSIIGQPSGGSTGQPLRLTLPGGGTARYCARRETYPDGKEFVGVGVIPQIVVEKNINDVYNGTDSVLKKALEVLK